MKKNVLVLLSFMLCSSLFVGCGAKNMESVVEERSADTDNVIVLAGNHSNSVKPNYDVMLSTFENVAYKYGDVCIVVNDGDPFIANDIHIPKQKNGLSSNKKKTIAKNQAIQMVDFLNMENSFAKKEGLDLIGSFELASRVLVTDDFNDGNTDIYIFDSGLSTLGIDFTTLDLNSADPSEIMRLLEEESMVPDLSGTNIYWYGLCDVKSPQQELSSRQKENVEAIWKAFLEKAGASVEFKKDISTDSFECEMPNIKTVMSMTSAVEWNSVKEDEFPEAVVFDEKSITFKSGSSQLLDEKKATSELEKSADYLKNHKDFKVLLVGSTACWGDQNEYCIPLSEERGITVKNILVSLGVSENQIKVVGMGYKNPFYQNDKKDDGSLNESVAAGNRCIIMIDSNSGMGQEILSGKYEV